MKRDQWISLTSSLSTCESQLTNGSDTLVTSNIQHLSSEFDISSTPVYFYRNPSIKHVERIHPLYPLVRGQDPRRSSRPFVILEPACLADQSQPIGWYLPEAAHPYHALSKDFTIVGASPKGGEAPVDETSVKQFMDDQGKFFLEDPTAKKVWQETKKISDVKASDYKAIFVVGGVSAGSR